jgi:hypothetical protein
MEKWKNGNGRAVNVAHLFIGEALSVAVESRG